MSLWGTFLDLPTTQQTPEPSHFFSPDHFDWHLNYMKQKIHVQYCLVRFKTSLWRLKSWDKRTSIVTDFFKHQWSNLQNQWYHWSHLRIFSGVSKGYQTVFPLNWSQRKSNLNAVLCKAVQEMTRFIIYFMNYKQIVSVITSVFPIY